MKNTIVITISCLALGLMSAAGSVFAHGTEKHDKGKLADVQMKKMHTMMPMFSLASTGLEAALEKGDATAAEAEGSKIITAIPDLKKSKPHKNVKQRKSFVELAGALETSVRSTLDTAKAGDFSGAKKAFKKVEETCAACHARFCD